ncbi:MAG: hypothetical protein NVSMB3_12530 [Acidobacteriaceae bacterium]
MQHQIKLQASRTLVPFLLSFAILVVLLNAWFAFRSVETLHNNQREVEHTWQVILQVERILSSSLDAETGNRGFLLTGDESYLDPYNSAMRDIPAELNIFRVLTLDNASQQTRLFELRAVLGQRDALLQQAINLRRSGASSGLQSLLAIGTGKNDMDQVRRIANDMETEERRLLARRTLGVESSARSARFAVTVASVIDLVLIVLMFRYFLLERRQRLSLEVTAENLAISRQQIEANAVEILALNTTLEEKVRQRTNELETTNRELEAFSYSVSHDLRAPLRTIDGFSLALEEDYAEAVDSVGRDYIQRVRAGVQRMGQLIDALLQLSRITRADITREDFNLSEIALSVAANLREENPGADLTFNIEPGLNANADPKLIRVALENLLGNAVKFSSRKPETVVDLGWDPAAQAWFVRDNGAGFDMYYSDKLFNAFNRLHGDKDFKGSGIGLATVARVIRRHHGRIWADSTVDHGATFWFTLG